MRFIRKYFPGLILLDTLAAGLLFVLISFILLAGGLVFRKWVIFLFVLAVAAGLVAGILQLLLKIRKRAVKFCLIGLFIGLLAAAGTVVVPVFLFAFAGEEHVVERDGAKYVAHVDGFLQTTVYYHDYKGFLVEGSALRIEEYYGKGGFDPIGKEQEYPVIRTTYYHPDGSIETVEADGI